MAKGDKKKVQNVADVSKGRTENLIGNVREGMVNPTTSTMYNAYQRAVPQAEADYGDIMNRYRGVADTLSTPYTAERVSYNRSPEMNEAFGGYRNFMNTGGYSDQDIADLRARGISPIRSVYANAMNEMARQKNVQGGYAPNMAAAQARMRSGTSQQIADNVQNVNAELARMRNEGQRFGITGMGNLATTDTEFGQQAQLANQAAGLQAAGLNRSGDNARLNAIQGMASLYGTTPGMANMFGNQVLDSTRNAMGLTNQEMQNQQMAMNNQMNVAATPSDFQVGMGRLGTGLEWGGRIAGAAMGLPNSPGMIPSTRVNIPGMYGSY